MVIVARTFPSLFFYDKIFVHCNDCNPICIICSRMQGPVCLRKAMDKQGNVTFGTPIKTCYTVPVIPGYRLVNAVQLSLQSGRNTQLRTCTILVIFSCFWNTTDVIVSNKKKKKTFIYITVNIYDIISFEELSFQSTLIRNYFYLLIFTCPRTS